MIDTHVKNCIIKKMDNRLVKIRGAYDLSVDQYMQGIDPLSLVPEKFKCTSAFNAFIKSPWSNSGSPDIKKYLCPKLNMRFLDAGCGGGLVLYKLYQWPCAYYGVDISPKVISAMKTFVRRKGLAVGGLRLTELSRLPFADNFFDIAAAIGVFEYYTLSYCKRALLELHRVLKPGSKMVIDIANLKHPYVKTMFKYENCLGREEVPKNRKTFERILSSLFMIARIDSRNVMLKYYLITL